MNTASKELEDRLLKLEFKEHPKVLVPIEIDKPWHEEVSNHCSIEIIFIPSSLSLSFLSPFLLYDLTIV